MTAYATRAPLHLIDNPRIMSETSRGQSRRTSARLAEKEDVPYVNGIGHESEPIKGRQIVEGKQAKGRLNGASTKPTAKRKPAYDEEDDGFAFTRTRSKRAKAEPVLASTAEEGRQEERGEPAPTGKPRKKSVSSPTAEPMRPEDQTGKRRSARHSGEHESAEPPVLRVKKRRKDRSPSVQKSDQGDGKRCEDHHHKGQDSRSEHSRSVEYTFDVTKIALPFADTPIIRRNKEMRKTNGSRRSSLGMRGRRASSLIDTGRSDALPHEEVESSEFYKHIESEGLSEPRRMKQLLTWCGTRAMGERPPFTSEDSNARLAAREIQSQLLKDFSTKSEMSDWFNRNDSTPLPSVPKPNPKNLSNLAKIQELEQQIARLQTERQQWEALDRGSPSDPSPMLEPLPHTPPPPSAIDADLLSDTPTQIAALQTLQSLTSISESAPYHQPSSSSSLTTLTTTRIHPLTQSLEFTIDTFASNIHTLTSYKSAAEGVADEVLGLCAEELERRDKAGRERANEKAGGDGDGDGEGEIGIEMRDVLRGLSRVI